MNAHTLQSIVRGITRPTTNSGGATGARGLLAVALLAAISGARLGAQTPTVYYACYVPSSTVYRDDAADLDVIALSLASVRP